MADFQHEAEAAGAGRAVADGQDPRREPARQHQSEARQVDEVALTAEDERPILHQNPQAHSEPGADTLLQPGRTLEALGRVDRLWESGTAGVETRPDLTAAGAVLGDGDHARHVGDAGGGQRRTDEAQALCQHPAESGEIGLDHPPGIDRALAHAEALGEAPPHRRRQPRPIRLRDESAEAQVEQFGRADRGMSRSGRFGGRAHPKASLNILSGGESAGTGVRARTSRAGSERCGRRAGSAWRGCCAARSASARTSRRGSA